MCSGIGSYLPAPAPELYLYFIDQAQCPACKTTHTATYFMTSHARFYVAMVVSYLRAAVPELYFIRGKLSMLPAKRDTATS